MLESRLVGYHVYRRCRFHACGLSQNAETKACENTWIRVTEQPVTATYYEDSSTGGLNGCFSYAVRPLGPDGEEGPIDMALEVRLEPSGESDEHCILETSLDTGWNLGPGCDDPLGACPRMTLTPEVELGRVNGISKGSGDAGGRPSPPQYVWSELRTKGTRAGDRLSKFARITWTPNSESDLAGYHVEMAGSSLGPWQRLTKKLVAWWESEYIVKGLGVNFPPGSANFLGYSECAQFRVIAVDENGNESDPSIAYPASECVPGATPPAPTGLQASTDDLTGDPCATAVQWNEVDYAGQDPSLFEYYVYRFTVGGYATYFYPTHFQAADDDDCLDNACCVDGICRYVERGTDSVNQTSNPETTCPWNNIPPGPSASWRCNTGLLDAYYITVKGPTGGESPRSEIVFWDCQSDPGYSKLETCPSDEEELILLASSAANPEACTQDPFEENIQLAQSDQPALLAPPRPTLKPAEPAIAALLKLGQTPSGPPFKLIDLHVDHLGSTRVTTDEYGEVLTQHDFFPFGEEIVPMLDDSTKLFTGHERDRETGLDYMLARYYGASLGRFLSTDPAMQIRKNLRSPQRWNRYVYVLNNPLKYYDPDGEELRLGTGADKSLAAIQLSVPKVDRGAITMGQNKAGQTIVKVDNSHKSSDLNFKNVQKAANSPGVVEINQTPANQPIPIKTADGSVKSASLAATGDPGRTLPSEGTKGAADAPTSTQPGVTEVHIASELSASDQAPVVAAELAGHAVPGPAIEQAKKNREEK